MTKYPQFAYFKSPENGFLRRSAAIDEQNYDLYIKARNRFDENTKKMVLWCTNHVNISRQVQSPFKPVVVYDL